MASVPIKIIKLVLNGAGEILQDGPVPSKAIVAAWRKSLQI